MRIATTSPATPRSEVVNGSIADRFRALLLDLVSLAMKDMRAGPVPIGTVLAPFMPMIGPAISAIPDHAALEIMRFVRQKLDECEYGESA